MGEWEDAPSSVSSGGWEDAPVKKKTPTLLDQAAGVAMSGADVLGIIPPSITALPLGLGDLVMNKRPPKQILESTEQAIQEYNLANKIPSADFYRETAGYKNSPITKLMELLGHGQKAVGKGVSSVAEALGAGEKKAEDLGATAEIGTMFLPLGFRKGMAKPGSDRAYFDVMDKKPTREQIAESQTNKAGYGPWEDAPPPKTTDVSVAGQMELPMQDPNIRSPYNLTPEQIAKAEQELNPPTEQRVTGQGELFTDERALTPDEAMNRKFPLEEPQVGARDRIITPEAERLQMDTPARVGEMEGRVGPPEQAMGGMGDKAALPFETTIGDLGQVGIDRARRLAEMAKEKPIPYEPTVRPIGPKSQRGQIHPDLLGIGKVADLIKNTGVRKALEKFAEGTFHPKILHNYIKKSLDPKSKETLVWMRPNDFHRLATDRDMSWDKQSESARRGVRGGLSTKEGLSAIDAIPELRIDKDGNVIAHEGRHRMDVFMENNVDMVPVRLKSDSIRWGETPVSDRPKQLHAQPGALNPGDSIPLPSLVSDQLRMQNILDRHRPMASQTGAMNFWSNKTADSVVKKGVVRTFLDQKKMFMFDKRPLAKMLEDERITPDTMNDLAETGTKLGTRLDRLLQTAMTNTTIDRQIAILSQSKGPVGKVIKWVVDNQNAINQKAKLRIEQAIEIGLNPWKNLRRSDTPALRRVLDVWQGAIGKGKLSELDFRSPKEWEVYKAASEQISALHTRVNEARVKAGLKPISSIENYFPAIREGDYWVHVIDSAGELKWSAAYSTVREAQAAHKLLQKEFGKEFQVKEPAIQKKGPYDLSSFSAFEETLRAMTKDDPIKEAIQARYAELVGKRGFGKTGIMRKDIGGAMGFEAGAKGVKNSEHVLEAYFKRGESYIANLERAQLQKQMQETPGKLWEKAPIAKKYLDEYLQKTRGAELDTLPMIRNITESISTEILGMGRNAPRQFTQNVASVMSLFWLMTPKFFLAQLAQPLNAGAKLVDLYQLGDKVSNPIHAYFDGYLQALSPDAISKEARKWAKGNGYLDSTIVSLLELKLHDLKGEKWRIIDDAARFTMGKIEGQVVRTPVFHMFEKALRKEVPDSKERFQMAANLMDNYMVHYDRESGPMMYDKAGLAGEIARPLKTYAHNYFGQFFEYAQTAKDTGSVLPLATMIGTQTLVSGLKGVMLAAEATAIIMVINKMFGTDIPTPEELLLSSGVSDSLIYGGYSTMIGHDISSSMASPAMPSMFSFPPAEFTAKAVETSWTYLRKKISGTATDQDAMAAMMAVSPTAMRGWIENLYSEPGKPIPKPTEKMKGNFKAPEDELERFYRFGLGLKSIDESKADAIARTTKMLLARDVQQKMSALDAIVDRVSNKQPVDKDLLERYTREGGDIGNLSGQIVQKMKERAMTFTDREQSKTVTPNQAHRLETMKQFLDTETKDMVEKEVAEGRAVGFQKMTVYGEPADVNRSKIKSVREQEKLAKRMDLRQLEAEAKFFFPGSKDKQMKWIRYTLETRLDQSNELKRFRQDMNNARRNYEEF